MTITLQALRGRVLDLDSHEQIPQAQYAEVFGDRGKRFLEVNAPVFDMIARVSDVISPGDGLHINVPDTAEITETTVWENKGPTAPSHADLDRRPAVLDMMGIQRQLVFPTMGLVALGQTQGGLTVGQLRQSTDEEKRLHGTDSMRITNGLHPSPPSIRSGCESPPSCRATSPA